MDTNLFVEINTEIKLKEDLATTIGIAVEDIPQEILDEAIGGALSMSQMDNMSARKHDKAGEMEWRRDMQGGKEGLNKSKTYRDPAQGGAPTMTKDADGPSTGDFVIVNGKPTKIVDTKLMFGGNEFVYLQGAKKPIIADRLKLHKSVGDINVFAIADR